ncbi:MAG TPA: hypothetical protein VGO50_10310 [Pyrinomonadaceae bacterium]|jgi:hypothetical protein|nr:hypothetical protein [Pyrinomonadaceae bacterium]
MFKEGSTGGCSLKAYQGANMTLLALDLDSAPSEGSFAGFTMGYIAPGQTTSRLIPNLLNFDGTEGLTESDVSPIQTFKWIHFPGSYKQVVAGVGEYVYQATPRYFDSDHKLLPLDPGRTISVPIDVGDFTKGDLSIGFTRAFLKSQAFSTRYGVGQRLKPKDGGWLFETGEKAGTNKYGDFTWDDMYFWLGYTARRQVYEMLDTALADDAVEVEMYAYDLNDPGTAQRCLDLGKEGRIRIILDSADLHTKPKEDGTPTPENDFEVRFNEIKEGEAEVFRCKFGRYSHCKIIILKKGGTAFRVLTGSTNFAVTGLCVNANHTIIFDRPDVAGYYSDVFNTCWKVGQAAPFRTTEYSTATKSFTDDNLPETEVNFSPHDQARANELLDSIRDNVLDPGTESVLFAVMEMGETSSGSIIPALRELHKNDAIYTYGVTDKSGGQISLYKPGRKEGLLVDAKKANRELPPPFQEEASLGLGHAIHHKFVITNFNRPNARVYCGSSNLAGGGEKDNGDNLICIKDEDVATAFAIEALRLTDHYNFRSIGDDGSDDQQTMTLDDTGKWVDKFFDPDDIRSVERKLFA